MYEYPFLYTPQGLLTLQIPKKKFSRLILINYDIFSCIVYKIPSIGSYPEPVESILRPLTLFL
jgi:hypothetical protein